MAVVVVVEPDESARFRMTRSLREVDLVVVEAAGGLQAIRTVFSARPQAIVMNREATEIDGLELLRVLRAACDVPLLVLSSDMRPSVTVTLLDSGADDVIDSGMSQSEFVARVRAAIRRYERQASEPTEGMLVRTGSLVIDRQSQVVTKHGRQVSLSRNEYRLLDALASRVGQVVPHRVLLSTVWGEACVDDIHYLRVYIGYLRNKLEDEPGSPRYLVNEWGVGYRLTELAVTSSASVPDAEPAADSSAGVQRIVAGGAAVEGEADAIGVAGQRRAAMRHRADAWQAAPDARSDYADVAG